MYFIMTVDVDPPIPSNPNQDIVKDGVSSLLMLFKKYDVKATFFVPAVVAENFPVVMKKILKQKHEIACHGLKHDPKETTSGLGEELKIIKAATEIIYSATGFRPFGFRAPLFRINESCWMALQKNGYIYDSSMVCYHLYLKNKIFSHRRPFPLSIPKLSGNHSLLEIPVSANPFFLFPLGGAYFRILGSGWSKVGVKLNFVFRNPVVFYIHPKDVDPRTRGRSWWGYRNTSNCMKMLEEIIEYTKRSGAKFTTAYDLARLCQGRIPE